jgi:hypothetical protein
LVDSKINETLISDPDNNIWKVFMFPAASHKNGLFKISGTNVYKFLVEDQMVELTDSNGYRFASGFTDSERVYLVALTPPGGDSTLYVEPVPTIIICSSSCNGHGTCNANEGRCDCTDGYSGDWCEVAPGSLTGSATSSNTQLPTADGDSSNANASLSAVATSLVLLLCLLLASL